MNEILEALGYLSVFIASIFFTVFLCAFFVIALIENKWPMQ